MDLKEIPGTNGRYSISTSGRVWSHLSNKYLSTTIINSGYQSLSLSNIKERLVHRLVALTYLGESKQKTVNHIDGDKLNNNISNLEYCTYSENERHAYSLGLKKRKYDKSLIKQLYLSGKTHAQIAKEIGCNRSSVSRALYSEFTREVVRERAIKSMAKTNKGRKMSRAQRILRSKGKFNVYKDGQFVAEFESMGYASEALGVSVSNIKAHLRGNYKQFNGYTAEWI